MSSLVFQLTGPVRSETMVRPCKPTKDLPRIPAPLPFFPRAPPTCWAGAPRTFRSCLEGITVTEARRASFQCRPPRGSLLWRRSSLRQQALSRGFVARLQVCAPHHVGHGLYMPRRQSRWVASTWRRLTCRWYTVDSEGADRKQSGGLEVALGRDKPPVSAGRSQHAAGEDSAKE